MTLAVRFKVIERPLSSQHFVCTINICLRQRRRTELCRIFSGRRIAWKCLKTK